MDEQPLALPGTPPKALTAYWDGLDSHTRTAVLPLILEQRGGVSAEWLADRMTKRNFRISATSIRTYRRAIARQEHEQ
jgi:hypothetical protein